MVSPVGSALHSAKLGPAPGDGDGDAVGTGAGAGDPPPPPPQALNASTLANSTTRRADPLSDLEFNTVSLLVYAALLMLIIPKT